jgi:hypothetical protein
MSFNSSSNSWMMLHSQNAAPLPRRYCSATASLPLRCRAAAALHHFAEFLHKEYTNKKLSYL